MVAVISCWVLDGSSYFLVGSGWSLLFLDGLWMVADILWCVLGGYSDLLDCSGWSLLFQGGLWMVGVISVFSSYREHSVN